MTQALGLSSLGTELLDDPSADPATVRQSLGNITRSNRWLGGRSALRFGLARAIMPDDPAQLTLLDVGSGAGDLALEAARWGRTRGRQIVGFGLDRSAEASRLAREHGLPAVVGCAGTLPMADRSVDLVLVSQVLHHLNPAGAGCLLAECARVTRTALIVSDLRRSLLAMAGFWAASRVLGFDPATRSDGLTSIRRGYTMAEFRAQLDRAGLAGAGAWARPGYRLVAVWRRDHAHR